MIFEETSLSDAYLIDLEPFRDDRGLFARTFCKKEFKSIGHKKEFVQLNYSVTRGMGTIRGMHYQTPPACEAKLVRCIRGKIFDVIIDLRRNSPTFRQWFSAELSYENMRMLYVPEGFAHGFQTLEEQCEIIYHHTEYYVPGYQEGVHYEDPTIAIKWPIPIALTSEKDKEFPFLDKNFQGISI